MSTPDPKRRPLQTSFAPAGPRQFTLEEAFGEKREGRPLRVAPEAQAKATKEFRTALEELQAPRPPPGPIRVPMRLDIAGAMGPRSEVTVPAINPAQRSLEPSGELGPRTFVINGIPEEVTRNWRMPEGFALRDYQEKALQVWLQAKRGFIVWPTGTGKTSLALAAILALKVPTLIIVHTRVLLTQWVAELRKWGIEAGVWYGEAKAPTYITVGLYQSLYANAESVRNFPALVFDEADLSTGQEWSSLIREAKEHPYVMALSATLPRQEEKKRALEDVLPIIIEEGTLEHIEAGHLVPTRLHPVPVSLTPEEQKLYDDVEERLRKLRQVLGTGDPARVAQLTGSNDPETKRAAFAYLKAMGARKGIVGMARNKFPALVSIVQQHPGERILVFSGTVEAAERACTVVNEAFRRPMCRIITGATDQREREYIFQEWGKEFFLLSSVNILRRGVNVPAVRVAIFLSGSSGRGEVTQAIGRVLRPFPGKEYADIYVVPARGTVDERLVEMLERLTQG